MNATQAVSVFTKTLLDLAHNKARLAEFEGHILGVVGGHHVMVRDGRIVAPTLLEGQQQTINALLMMAACAASDEFYTCQEEDPCRLTHWGVQFFQE